MTEPAEAGAPLVCDSDNAPRLDRFLSRRLPEHSRTRLQALIAAGAVTVDGVVAERASLRLGRGARVEVAVPAAPPENLEPEDIPLDILYEDEELVAVNKAAGLVVHPGAGRRTGTLVHALLYRYGRLPHPGGEGPTTRPGIVHRLDRGTSGVMVVARTEAAHRALAEQFRRRTVGKTYLALVEGAMKATRGEIELPIGRDRHQRLRMSTRHPQGRAASTSYRVLETFAVPRPAVGHRPLAPRRYSWLEVRIHTGRTHQIRVHLAALGHPVVGDRLYGAGSAAGGPPASRVMLHAWRLEVAHPVTGAPLAFTAPMPEDVSDALDFLRAAGAPQSEVRRSGEI